MSTSQSLELYFYCDDGPSMWVWWLKINRLKEHTLNQQQCVSVGLRGKEIKNIIMVVGCPSGPPDYKDVTKEHYKGEKKVCLHLYINIYMRAGYKIWLELKLTANCDVIQTVPWILSLACAAEPFLNEVLAVILKTFVLKPVINVCSFILTVITKEMWLLSKLVPDCFSFIPCVVLGISFLTTFCNWRSKTCSRCCGAVATDAPLQHRLSGAIPLDWQTKAADLWSCSHFKGIMILNLPGKVYATEDGSSSII